MRRVTQRQFVATDGEGLRIPPSRGDCYPACIASIFDLPLALAPGLGGDSQDVWEWLALNYPGIGMVVRDWPLPRDPDYHAGFWIAAVQSARFKERCRYCSPEREKSDPPTFWRRDECPVCDKTGIEPGTHAIVMEHLRPVWDPHPEADGLAGPYKYVGETFFTVTDPSKLAARVLPTPSHPLAEPPQ